MAPLRNVVCATDFSETEMSEPFWPSRFQILRGRQQTPAAVPPVSAALLDMIRSEYDEMPGMRLTLVQCRRLWRLPEDACAAAIEELVGNGFLRMDSHGRIQRAGDLVV